MSKQFKYDRNIPFDNLPLLPPPDENIITIEVLKSLNDANKALAELKGLARMLPNQAMLVNTISLREAKASTEIENIFTTDDELYKSLTLNSQELKGNAKEVLFYRQALWTGVKNLEANKQIDSDVIIKIYREIKQVNDGIRPSQTATVVKKRDRGLLGGTVVYTPPRGIKIIKAKLNNLFDYINDDETYDYDPLIKLAISHYQFEAIHPFRDGNGRTGRILSILMLIQKGLLEFPILYLSAFIIKEKDDYYNLLNSVTTRNNWKAWIIYMLKAVEQTSLYTINKIEEIDNLFNTTLELISNKLPHIRKETVELLFEQPYISPKRLIDNNIKSLNTAKKYLNQMELLGIVSSTKIGKEIVYLNIDLYNLLSQD
ncbi:MAG: Fic family protein [Bacteroidetes bacterium]|nr:Fic family protein [Bacteroidota bacterium]